MHKILIGLFAIFLTGAAYTPGIPIPNKIQDADEDTKILVEETPDQDKIKAFVAGALRVLYDTNHFEFTGETPGNVGGFASGLFHIKGLGTLVNSNAVLTGHSSFGGNKQLWYLGSVSSSSDDIAYINRQNGSITISPNNTPSAVFKADGKTNILGVLEVETIASLLGDLNLTTFTGGVFQFNDNSFRAGLDAVEYVEVGHGGGNGFINAVGDGGLDFRFEGDTLATFTDFGHLHLMTNVDQKHTLKIITANNLNDTGIAWENSGGSFTGTIFRTDVGSNRADLVFAVGQNADIDLLTDSFKIHGSAASEGRLEVLAALQISSGTPGLNKVLTSDATGIATWQARADDLTLKTSAEAPAAVFSGSPDIKNSLWNAADEQGYVEVEGTVVADKGGLVFNFVVPDEIVALDKITVTAKLETASQNVITIRVKDTGGTLVATTTITAATETTVTITSFSPTPVLAAEGKITVEVEAEVDIGESAFLGDVLAIFGRF